MNATISDWTGRPLNDKLWGQCACNASNIMDILEKDNQLRELLRGPPGLPGKEGKAGQPGLTVSKFVALNVGAFIKIRLFLLIRVPLDQLEKGEHLA